MGGRYGLDNPNAIAVERKGNDEFLVETVACKRMSGATVWGEYAHSPTDETGHTS